MMSSSKSVGKRLSERLKSLRKHHHHQQHIWDIGCDHGHLGMSFYGQEGVSKVHLLDPAEAVIDQLKLKYKDSYITNGSLNIIHSKGQDLKIKTPSNCIFIAGMGGTEIGEIIENILPQLDSDSYLVISPHRKILELRAKLERMSISLVKEEVVFENKQFYQILVLRPGVGAPVTRFGHELWMSRIGEQYRVQQIEKYGIHKDKFSIEYLEYLKSMVE